MAVRNGGRTGARVLSGAAQVHYTALRKLYLKGAL